MKLLIISSEPLNPDNILSSIFELTQASLLKRISEVCILSVSPQDTISARVKLKMRLILGKRKAENKLLVKPHDNILSTVVLGKNRTNFYTIDGIPVIEGKNYHWFSRGTYFKSLNSWIRAGKAAYRNYQVQFGKPDIIHAHGRFMSAGLLALKIHESEKIPFVYTEHSTAYHLGIAPLQSKPFLMEIAEKASAVVVVSKPLLNDFELFLGKKLQKAKVIPNTIDPIFESPLNKTIVKDQFRFICIASFHPKKGLDILLHSFKLAFNGEPRYKLTISGDGPLKDDLFILRNQLGLEGSVQFTGNITKQEVKRMLDASNVLVVSSLHETFGVVVIEALSRGCPVISTRCGGPEYIINEESGILVKAEDKNELAEALKKMATIYSSFDLNKIQEQTISKYGSKAFLQASEILYQSVLEKTA